VGLRLRVGAAEIAMAEDAVTTSNIGRYPRSSRQSWLRYLPDLPESGDFPSRVMTFVIRSQGKTILVDSGVGNWDSPTFGNGHLLDSLAALDLAPEQIDFVMPTHMHGDHIGWNTRPSPSGPVPTFQRARYLFQQAEWDYFTSDAYLANRGGTIIENCVLSLKDSGLMDLIGSEAKVTDEVTLLHAPGHTPGQVAVLVQSQGEAALLVGDAFHNPAQFTETEWSHMVDVDPDLSARTRRALLKVAAAVEPLVAGAHFNRSGDPFCGQVVAIDGRTYWRGVELP
jgi:glyoxylase-like metal-dependent hydrolase (beta-lactamase superfamily II)